VLLEQYGWRCHCHVHSGQFALPLRPHTLFFYFFLFDTAIDWNLIRNVATRYRRGLNGDTLHTNGVMLLIYGIAVLLNLFSPYAFVINISTDTSGFGCGRQDTPAICRPAGDRHVLIIDKDRLLFSSIIIRYYVLIVHSNHSKLAW